MVKLFLSAGEQPPVRYRRAAEAQDAVPIEEGDPLACDGLVLCGGGDVEPRLYGEPNRGSRNISLERDRRELRYIEAFLKAGKPILGICRGMQILNVAFGGSLVQHLPSAAQHYAAEGDVAHPIVAAGLLQRLCGSRPIVCSSHHQGVARLGSGFRVIGRAEDGVIEAILQERLPILGVQFHPERMAAGDLIWKWFIGIARADREPDRSAWQ